MKRKSLRLAISALSVTLMMGLLAGCGAKTEEKTATKELSGSITAVGSTALQPLVEKAGKNFMDKNPGVTVSVQGGGSGTGLTQVSQKAVEIGNSDIYAEEKLKDNAKDLVDHIVVAQGFALTVSSDVKVDSLTKAQIKDIFSGKITNWKEVGGDDAVINVIHRPASSGTRTTFVKTVLDGDAAGENDQIGTTQDSNGAVEKSLESTKGSISYLALAYLKEAKGQIKNLKIDGVEANKENIVSKKYPFYSYGHMYTNGEPNEVTKAFLDYMLSDENKKAIEDLGYIPGSELK
ncbi:MAG: phosphate ABC transporter substrate-binding protein [Clostridiaceae bacterium]